MAKYPEKVRTIRKVSKEIIPKILKRGPQTISTLIENIKQQEPDLCDDSVKCECGGFAYNRPEWKHQIQWAIVDLKYSGKITYSKESKIYALV